MRTPEVSQTQKRTAINSAIGNSLTVVPILVYQVSMNEKQITNTKNEGMIYILFSYITFIQVLLADKLDGDLQALPFSIISIPLFMGLFALILLSFNSKGGNKC